MTSGPLAGLCAGRGSCVIAPSVSLGPELKGRREGLGQALGRSGWLALSGDGAKVREAESGPQRLRVPGAGLPVQGQAGVGLDATVFRQLGHNQVSGEKETGGFQRVTAPPAADFKPLLMSLNEELGAGRGGGTNSIASQSSCPALVTKRRTDGGPGAGQGRSMLRVFTLHSCAPHDDSCAPKACGTEGQRRLSLLTVPWREPPMCTVGGRGAPAEAN